MVEINTYFNNTFILKDSVLYIEKKSFVSYPQDGNDHCFHLEQNSFWFRHRNNIILKAIQTHTTINSILDIGGGNGFVSKYLEDNNIESILIEPGIAGCLNAKKRNIKNIICASTNDLDIIPSSVPAVGMFDVLEHIENDDKIINDIFTILKTNGYFILTVPAFKMLWSNDDVDAGHFRRYTLKKINKKLVNSGFNIVFSTYFFSILPLPVFIFRSIPSFFSKKSNITKKHTNEHKKREGFFGKILSKVWDKEMSFINSGKKISFGTSCLIIAQKT